MSENGNKWRLMSIGGKVKEARENMGLTQEQFADKYGYARTTLAKLEAGIRDFKSTEIITLAEQLDVSCDYLLGRSRAAMPDDFMQEVVRRYGLTEKALKLLERLNAPLGIDGAEKDRVTAKYEAFINAVASTMDSSGEIPIVKDNKHYRENLNVLHDAPPLGGDEVPVLIEIWQDEFNKRVLGVLNDVFTVPTGNDWETYGMQILNLIYDACLREYETVLREERGITGLVKREITPEMQQQLCELQLIETLAELRAKLKVG